MNTEELTSIVMVNMRLSITSAITSAYWEGYEACKDDQTKNTCTMRNISWDNGECTWGCKCMSCGEKFEHQKAEYGWHYCPNCGARVVEE